MCKKLMFLVSLVAVLSLAVTAQANLLTNPGFEDDYNGWTLWAWEAGYNAINTTNAYDGLKCAEAGQTNPWDWGGGAGAYQLFPLPVGTAVSLEGYGFAEGASPRATLVIAYMDGADVELSRDEFEIHNWVAGDWTYGKVEGIVPLDCVMTKFEISSQGGQGYALYDNLIATPEPATIALLGFGGLALLRIRKRG